MKYLITTCLSILVIGALEYHAQSLGLNGTLMSGTIAVIAGLGGYTVSKVKRKNGG